MALFLSFPSCETERVFLEIRDCSPAGCPLFLERSLKDCENLPNAHKMLTTVDLMFRGVSWDQNDLEAFIVFKDAKRKSVCPAVLYQSHYFWNSPISLEK